MSIFSEAFGPNGFVPPADSDKDDFGVIPTGWYQAEVAGIESRTTRDEKGKYLSVEYSIISGDYERRKVWQNINFFNQKEKTQAIGQKELGRLVLACGFPQNYAMRDENELVGKFLDIKVGYKPAKDGYKESNTVDKTEIYGSSANNAQQPTAPAAPALPAVPQVPQVPVAPVVPQAPVAPVAPPPIPQQVQQPAPPVVPQQPVQSQAPATPALPWKQQ